MIPLKGRRRALGAIVIEEVRRDGWRAGDIAAHATELGHQMSAALENLLLLHDVIHSRRELENTFNSITDLIAVCDRQLRLVHVNNVFAERVGLEREALDSRGIAEFLGKDLRAWLTRMDLDGASPPASLGPLETSDAALGGSVSVTVMRLMSQASAAVGLVMVARDISDRVRLEAERAALRASSSKPKSSRRSGTSSPGSRMSSTTRSKPSWATPIYSPQPPRCRARSSGTSAPWRAKRSAPPKSFAISWCSPAPGPAPNGASASTRSSGGPWRRGACRSADITLAATLSAVAPRVMGDPRLLQQALLNILTNAEHAVTGGVRRRVWVPTRVDPRRSMVAISVRDSSAGIPDAALPHLFEPFHTTREVGDGTGLGLAITDGVVRDHDGEIAGANDRRAGAVFTVWLPWLRSRVTSSTRIR